MTASNQQTIPLLDVGRGNHPLLDEIMTAIRGVCESGRFLHGPEVGELEDAFCKSFQVRHAIGCASGSDSLLLAMMAIGIEPGDEVIMPSFTFFATASAVWRLGAKPVFVDIDPGNFNIDPQLIEDAISPATKAIVPVHLFGQCADMDAICELGRKYQLKIVEDAAQAVGARCNGEAAGAMGDIGCFSFYPTKNLGAFGDGGMLTTNDDHLADQLRLLASHGMRPRYYHSKVGVNSRLDTIQAAVLGVKMRHLPQITAMRQANAACYERMLRTAGLDGQVILPMVSGDHTGHVWNQYTIRVLGGQRDAFRQYLSERNIGTEIYYPVPLHEQECFRSLNVPTGSLPHTERVSREVLSLPIFAELREEEQQAVVRTISDFLLERRASAA